MKFKSFYDSLLIFPSKEARMMVRISEVDIRYNTGSNIRMLKEETKNWHMSTKEFRNLLRKKGTIEVPRQDFWLEASILKKIATGEERDTSKLRQTQKELQSLIDSLCIN